MIDLHSHTTVSDGRLSPEELVRLAARNGVRHLAVTDHDTTDGLAAAMAAAYDVDVEVIPGIEVSADIPGTEVHLIGLYLKHEDEAFQARLTQFREGRVGRAQQMVVKLGELGMPLRWERVQELAGEGSVGRPHVAQALLEAGYIGTIAEAFEKYIGRNGPAYAERFKLTLPEAIALVHQVGGVASLAHPYETPGVLELLPELVEAGLDAVEVYYTGYGPDRIKALLHLVRHYKLIATGGSDYHGFPMAGLKEATNEPGTVSIPDSVLDDVHGRRSLRSASAS